MKIKYVWLTTVPLICVTAVTVALWYEHKAPPAAPQSIAKSVADEAASPESTTAPPPGMRPVFEARTKLINYTATRPVYEKHEKEISYTVMRPVHETRQKVVTYTVCTMVPETKTKTVSYTTCRYVSETRQKTIEYNEVRYVPIDAPKADSE
jgi:predicted outer membrane lipoprotein